MLEHYAAGRDGVLAAYEARVAAGEIEPDDAQRAAILRLDSLAAELAARKPQRRSLWSAFSRPKQLPPPKGLYLHGGVGRGKTMLMDLFFAGVDFTPKDRLHFHEFMAQAHELIGKARKEVKGDPIPAAALTIAERAGLLCFDELHVTDIADAMILGRLFKVLFERGVVVVATSNARPSELYRNGLNRQLFLPFVDLIEDHMAVHEVAAAKDFRLDKLAGHPLYFAPADHAAADALDRLWRKLTGLEPGAAPSRTLAVKGREIEVPQSGMGVARFTFEDLCARPLGAQDYLRIAREFHTVMIDGIPVLPPARRNEARRFINLIDALYDNKVGLIASAEAEPRALYTAGDGAELFERTVSRLMEMRSPSYLAARDDRAAASQKLL